jgi:predicted NBD/HSP70 family sugar kinase
MKFYAGLDISQNETAICVLDETGLIVREQKVITEPEALICALRACNVSFERVGLETRTSRTREAQIGRTRVVLNRRVDIGERWRDLT